MRRIKRLLGLAWALRPGGELHSRTKVITTSHDLDIKVVGEIPKKQCILVSNHLGYLDPIIIASLVKCRPIAKRELANWPGIGGALKRLGLIFYDRGNVASGARVLRRAIRALFNKENILVFPEGTTTRGDLVLPFKRGMFGVSKLTGIPVVPIRVDFANPDTSWAWEDTRTFMEHYWWQIGLGHTDVTVKFFDPVYPNANEAPCEMAARVHRLISLHK